jgi:hypothetical protein
MLTDYFRFGRPFYRRREGSFFSAEGKGEEGMGIGWVDFAWEDVMMVIMISLDFPSLALSCLSSQKLEEYKITLSPPALPSHYTQESDRKNRDEQRGR